MEGGLLPTPNPSAQGGGEQAGHGKTLALPEGDAPRGHRGANPATPGQPTPSPLVGEGSGERGDAPGAAGRPLPSRAPDSSAARIARARSTTEAAAERTAAEGDEPTRSE